MSGIVGSTRNIRGSGRIAKLGTDGQVLTSSGAGVAANYEDLAGGISWQSVVTGSTMTAVAGEGYWINTTSNACTITLPSSASVGDTIIFADYARNWGTNGIIIDSNGLNYQGDADTFTVEYGTDGLALGIFYADSTKGWVPTFDDAVEDVPSRGNQNGIFGFGNANKSMTNLVSNVGVIATDTTGVGTGRDGLGSTQYGGDKGIFAFGNSGSYVSMSNLVSNAGVVATDVSGVGTARTQMGSCSFGGSGGDKGIMAYGNTGSMVSLSNLISNAGVVATDTTGVGTATKSQGACEYGTDTAICAYGTTYLTISHLISNVGVVGADVASAGTGKQQLAACSYGYDKGILGYGDISGGGVQSTTNLVSNAGVISTDVTGVGTARKNLVATEYGGDKGIFGFGYSNAYHAQTNLVSNQGVVATDTTGVGTARGDLGACAYN